MMAGWSPKRTQNTHAKKLAAPGLGPKNTQDECRACKTFENLCCGGLDTNTYAKR